MAWTAAETAKFNALRNDVTKLENFHNGLINETKAMFDALDGVADDQATLNARFDKWKVRPGTPI